MARWLEQHGYETRETLSAGRVCELAYAWWNDRLTPGWRPHTLEQNQAILDGLGLTGPFWNLT